MKRISLLLLVLANTAVFAQNDETKEKIKGNFFGGIESNSQWYTNDKEREIKHPEDPFRSNNYLNLNYNYGKWTAGIQGESYAPNALLNYNPKYDETNVGTYYVNYKSTKLDVTAGYFYEQFGSGLLLRSWEDRSLGINNAIRGGKVTFTPTDNLLFTALYGSHRTGFDVSEGDIYGFNSDINIFRMLNVEGYDLSVGLSYVGRYEKSPIIDSNFDELTNAYAGRISFSRNNFYASTEYNYKSEDAVLTNSFVNNNFIKPGSALLLNLGYSKKGFGIDANFRRIENMSFYSEREPESYGPGQDSFGFNDKIMNFVPSLTKQHHFNLANIYVYQAQAQVLIDPSTLTGKAGEIGGQIDLFYDFAKGTSLGGKYGTKLAVNFSNWSNLDGEYDLNQLDYKTDFLGFGNKYFSDLNIEVTKKLNSNTTTSFAYINQYYNDRFIRGAFTGPTVNTHIVAAELDYKLTNGRAAKIAVEHMWADSDRKNWAAILLEYNINTKFSVFASDMYNYGYEDNPAILIDADTDKFDIHFYNFGGAYKQGSTRIALNYGRQRGGLVCAGGVCRVVPASTGLGITLTKSF